MYLMTKKKERKKKKKKKESDDSMSHMLTDLFSNVYFNLL
jgi:hypothetical protein